MNRESLKKVKEEKALSPLEMFDLERQLDLQEKSGLAHLAGKGRDPEPSLAWRSSLNEKLAALAPAPKRTPWWSSALKWAAPAVAAAVLAVVVFNAANVAHQAVRPKAESRAAGRDVEDTIVMIHRINASAEDTGLVMPVESGKSYQWSALEAF